MGVGVEAEAEGETETDSTMVAAVGAGVEEIAEFSIGWLIQLMRVRISALSRNVNGRICVA